MLLLSFNCYTILIYFLFVHSICMENISGIIGKDMSWYHIKCINYHFVQAYLYIMDHNDIFFYLSLSLCHMEWINEQYRLISLKWRYRNFIWQIVIKFFVILLPDSFLSYLSLVPNFITYAYLSIYYFYSLSFRRTSS